MKQQGELRELKEKHQQEIELQVAKQLQLNENAQATKQNQVTEIGRLMEVIDKRNGDLEKNVKLGKETKSHNSCGSHKVGREAWSGSKPLGNIERLWLNPPSSPPFPLPSPPPPPPLWTLKELLRTIHFKQT